MADRNYSCTIKECSKELSPKERVMLKKIDDCNKIDEILSQVDEIAIDIDYYCVLEVHNESDRVQNKEYNVYILADKDGQKYVTSSDSLFTSFMEIYEELADCEDEWKLKVFKRPSKNFNGKDFFTCTVV